MKLKLENIEWEGLSGKGPKFCLLFKINIEDSVVFHKAPVFSLISWEKNTDWLVESNYFLSP